MSVVNPLRGEIWRVDLDPSEGAEMQKIRPCVVVSNDGIRALPLRLVVPITAWQNSFALQSWKARLAPDASNGLTKPSCADTIQTRCVDLRRFVNRVGVLSNDDLDVVTDALHLTASD